MAINKVILIGHVGAEPDVKVFEGGAMVATVRLATTEKGYTLQNGTQVPDRTDWHTLVFRGKLPQVVQQYVHKGDKLYVEGKLRVRTYEDNKQIKHTIVEVFVDNMEMLTSKPQQAVQQQPAQQAYFPPQQPVGQPQQPAQQQAYYQPQQAMQPQRVAPQQVAPQPAAVQTPYPPFPADNGGLPF